MHQSIHLIGREDTLREITRAIRNEVQALHAPVVGALHVTCSDESERECLDAFQTGFVKDLLPTLKSSRGSAFRVATLGGRYEGGGVRIAEQHFATKASEGRFKVMAIKINAHVAVEANGPSPRFGRMQRYGKPSACCGALHALLDGAEAFPALLELREIFLSEGLDRVSILLDAERVDPSHRALYAALASARLQARRVMLDIQDYIPETPTIFLVYPCVTLNRPREDTEILCGVYHADVRSTEPTFEYTGLGDDPSVYRLEATRGVIQITTDRPDVR